jgi:hypothetical protein
MLEPGWECLTIDRLILTELRKESEQNAIDPGGSAFMFPNCCWVFKLGEADFVIRLNLAKGTPDAIDASRKYPRSGVGEKEKRGKGPNR